MNTRGCLFGLAGLVLTVGGAMVVAGAAAQPAFADAGKPKPNACGCYRDSTGACFCGKKGKCACPGECEPKGCEEKRAKELDKEIAAETKKAASGHATKEKESASKDDDGGGGKKEKVVHMAPAKKKELLHLLDAYLAEHPEGGSQTISEVKRTLSN